MPNKYIDIYDQLLKNSKWNGECLETTYKVKSKHKTPQVTHKQQLISVHRASWIYHKGEIPKGMFICHHCDNPKCFRIEHLFLGTPSDNMQDMIKKRRDNIWGARKYSFDILEKAARLREEGFSYAQIADKLQVNRAGIQAYLIRHQIKKQKNLPRPSKYNDEIRKKCKDLSKSGLMGIEIKKIMNIPRSAVYRILSEPLKRVYTNH